MEEYIKWLEKKIELCLDDKDLQREHWAFCQALKKYRELALRQPLVSGQSEQSSCDTCVFNTHSWSEDYPCATCCGFDKHQAT